MSFAREIDFEDALVKRLTESWGWSPKVLNHPTEDELIKNWAKILFENNRQIDRLNNVPLSDGEMRQILEQVREHRTPLKLNGFINGKEINIIRDNPEDALHLGKTVTLKIYDRMEIAGGKSRYQIARQPHFSTHSHIMSDRRGDVLLLINGMPVIHVELKRSGVPVSQASHQIEKYSHEGVFSGLFSLVQIFVAMNPEETLYFANPGEDGKFNPDYYFHWADFNNEPVNDWQEIAEKLLSIPMAHQMIGFYTVADDTDGVLKVMRSYQYYAANKISDRVSRIQWDGTDRRGGYVWHTTGSGKTMTSFKSAQLIASSQDADKVIFLMDRIELGTQSLADYKGISNAGETVQSTENTHVLVERLKSDDPADTLIVTSIQKMSNIREEDGGVNEHDIELMNKKRIVIIIDECHRSTFGEMLFNIKKTFPTAVLFGFTGTPIQEENQRKHNTTMDIFGDELHRYSIADGIRDKNVLGFDPYQVFTYSDKDLRMAVALSKCHASSEEEALADEAKSKVYYRYMSATEVPMVDIESELPVSQYDCDRHRRAVSQDIIDNWNRYSRNRKFHAILATSSIPEAIEYFKILTEMAPNLRITALFDPSIDNTAGATFKEDALVSILEAYNNLFNQKFTIPTYDKFKKDVSNRLAHKKPYENIQRTPELQLDLLIVVDQMLTGFDSKWINTLYLDKVLYYENIIQAFSRTNRLFNQSEKPFGTIRYYRKPHTMKQNIENAVKLYSGDRPFGMFVEHLDQNLLRMNQCFTEIKLLFDNAKIPDFCKLPEDDSEKERFAKLFRQLNDYQNAAKIQGFTFEQNSYSFKNKPGNEIITMMYDESTFNTLVQRYKELSAPSGSSKGSIEPAFDIDTHIMEYDTEAIDQNYMNSRFDKYLLALTQKNIDEAEKEATLSELHKSFATLTQEEQKYAIIFLHDIESGHVQMQPGKKFSDYVTEYRVSAKDRQIEHIHLLLGVDKALLITIMQVRKSNGNIDEYGRFSKLMESVDKNMAKRYFEALKGKQIRQLQANMETDRFLRSFIESGGFDVEIPESIAIELHILR